MFYQSNNWSNKLKKSFLIVCLYCCSANIFAHDNNFYLGLGLGLADVSSSLDYNTFVDGLSVVEGGAIKISQANRYDVADDTSFSYRAFGGYSLNEIFSFELSVYDFGKVDATQKSHKEFSNGNSPTNSRYFELSTIAITLSALFSYPVSDSISLYANIGGAWSQQKQKYESANNVLEVVNSTVRNANWQINGHTEKENHVDATYGLGGTIKINKSFKSRVSISGIELKRGRIFDYGLSLIYRI